MITEATLTAGLEPVWRTLTEIERWSSWWRWARRIEELAAPDESGVGGVYLNEMTTPLVYGFVYETEVVELTYPELIRVRSTGDLEGDGLMTMNGLDDGGTRFEFHWLVQTPRPWMNVLAPLLRPMFVWNHNRLMEDFGAGLAEEAGGTLVELHNRQLPPDHRDFFVLPV